MNLLCLVYVVIVCTGYPANSQNVMTNEILDDMLINTVVDELLKFARIAIVEQGLDRVLIPDINETFDGPLDITAEFTASNGRAGYLSTVQRTGDATISYHLKNSTLKLDLGLRRFVVDYPIYKAKVLSVGPTGAMEATIGENSIYATFNLYYGIHTCKQELGYLTMDKFENVNVNLTGLYPLDWLLNDLAAWITTDLKPDIKFLIEDTVRNGIKTAMQKYNLCKYLPHY